MSLENCRTQMEIYRDELNDLKELDVQEMLHYLIKVGEEVEPLSADEIIEENKVSGCVSQVYVIVDSIDGMFHLKLYSDAMVVKGFLATIYKFCKELSNEEFHLHGRKCIEDFCNQVDLHLVLSPSRVNGFGNAIDLICKKNEVFIN